MRHRHRVGRSVLRRHKVAKARERAVNRLAVALHEAGWRYIGDGTYWGHRPDGKEATVVIPGLTEDRGAVPHAIVSTGPKNRKLSLEEAASWAGVSEKPGALPGSVGS